jgi:hypothetical protein
MKNFTISLYAFHQRHTLNNPLNKVNNDADHLWRNLAELGKSSLPFPGLCNLLDHLISFRYGEYNPQLEQREQFCCLTEFYCLDLGAIPTTKGFKIEANLLPFRLNDTYAANLTLFPESPDIEIGVDKIKYFNPSFLLPNSIQASLGQTLWIYGEVDKK